MHAFAIVAFLMLAEPAAEPAGPAEPAPAAQPAAPPGQPAAPARLICKTSKKTGSFFKQKTCRTAEEWNNQTRKDQETFREIQNKGAINPGLGQGG